MPSSFGLYCRPASAFEQDPQHATQRFGRTPQQLVAYGEGGQVLGAHVELAQTTHRHLQGTGHRSRGQLADCGLFLVRHHLGPGVVGIEHGFDVRQRYILVQLDGQRLTVAPHGTDAHTDAVHRNRATAATDDLVGFGLGLPLFTTLTVGQLLVDPGDQAAGQRHAEVVHREGGVAHGGGDLAIDVEDGTGRVGQLVGDTGVQTTHLADQLTHVLGTGTTGGLIGHGGHPLDQTVLEQATEAHQHQTDGTVAADVGLDAVTQGLIDAAPVDRVQHDDGLVFHAQGRGRVDPVTLPAVRAQLGIDLVGVITTLAGNDDVHWLESIEIVGIFQCRDILADIRTGTTHVGRGEEHRVDGSEIIFLAHPLHEHRAHHTAPANQTNLFHNSKTPMG